MGRISGKQEITLPRIKLSNGNIAVYFILDSKYTQTSGTLVEDSNNTQLTFIAHFFNDPSFINSGTLFQ